MSRYLTAEEAAETLRVSVSWVYRHKELLGGVRLGDRLWRFPEQELPVRLAQPAAPPGPPRAGTDRGPQPRPTPARTQKWRLG
jgi:excisionase family DNA binding protein